MNTWSTTPNTQLSTDLKTTYRPLIRRLGILLVYDLVSFGFKPIISLKPIQHLVPL